MLVGLDLDLGHVPLLGQGRQAKVKNFAVFCFENDPGNRLKLGNVKISSKVLFGLFFHFGTTIIKSAQFSNIIDQKRVQILSIGLDIVNELRVFRQLFSINNQGGNRGNKIGAGLIEHNGMKMEGGENVGDGKELHFVISLSEGDFLEFLGSDDCR